MELYGNAFFHVEIHTEYQNNKFALQKCRIFIFINAMREKKYLLQICCICFTEIGNKMDNFLNAFGQECVIVLYFSLTVRAWSPI